MFSLTCLFAVLSMEAKPPVEPPKRVMIIRHAEKLNDATFQHLSPLGDERAKHLPELFDKSKSRPEPLPLPEIIIAASNKPHSHRPLDTITPLAKHLKIDVNSQFSSEEPQKLAMELLSNKKYSGKIILVSWRHSSIPELATFLGAKDVPKSWKDETFDRLWDLKFNDGRVSFTDHPQKLLAGDSQE